MGILMAIVVLILIGCFWKQALKGAAFFAVLAVAIVAIVLPINWWNDYQEEKAKRIEEQKLKEKLVELKQHDRKFDCKMEGTKSLGREKITTTSNYFFVINDISKTMKTNSNDEISKLDISGDESIFEKARLADEGYPNYIDVGETMEPISTYNDIEIKGNTSNDGAEYVISFNRKASLVARAWSSASKQEAILEVGNCKEVLGAKQ